MTTRLAQALVDASEQAPPVPSPEELWRHGRRRRRRRRATAALACLLLVAALAWAPVRSRPDAQFAGTDAAVLPAAVAEPHLWQRTVHGDANGPAKLVFATGHSLNMESALVVIGADGSYRLDYLSPGEEPGALSPDGRWLLGQHLFDLTNGKTRELDPPLTGYPRAVWAPDSRTAVGVFMPDGGGTSYGPDGELLDGPDDQILLVDVAHGTTRQITTVPEGGNWQAAFSPDGHTVAIHAAYPDKNSTLSILDTRGTTPPRTVTLTERQRLAGPAAWTPDGTQILLAAGDGCAWPAYCPNQTWHLQRVDVATGAISDETARGRPGSPSVVAWRDGEPVAQLTRDPHDHTCDTVVLTETGARPLPLTVAGHGCADYARDLLEDGALGGPGIEPSPWQAQWWAYALVAIALAVLVQIARRLRRRLRS